jgi:uncharacterized protein (DUF1501 family)
MMTRRVFLKSSGVAMLAFGAVPRALLRSVYAAETPRRRKCLVVVFQRGACDGLNTVIPIGESNYHSLRPTIAVPRDKAISLDGFFALHPSLAKLQPLWDERSLAIVHAVGSPDATRSHFDAQDFMESGTPGRKATEDGWMNRHLASNPDPHATPFRAVSMTPNLPRSLAGHAPAVAMASVREFGLRPSNGPEVKRGFEDMYGQAVHDVLHGAGHDTFEAVDYLRRADPSRYQPQNGAVYPGGPYGQSLQQIAQLIKADVGLEMAFTEIQGWDHHAGEGGTEGQLANRLRELAGALSAFHRDLGNGISDVVVVTMTEFGRTVRENGNRGTDHGHGSVSFVMGGPVSGGHVRGRWPGLRDGDLYEGRDLAITTDFRDLLGEILVRHVGERDLAAVFPGYAMSAQRFPGVIRA